jgi:hypothetical protein
MLTEAPPEMRSRLMGLVTVWYQIAAAAAGAQQALVRRT